MCRLPIIVGALLVSSVGLADDIFISGPYVGVQGGWTDMHYSGPDYLLSSNSIKDQKFGGRIYGGYAFSEFIAAELGYDYFGTPKIKHDPTGNEQDFIQQGLDLTGKVTVPLDYGISFFGKIGLDWVHRDAVESRSGYFAERDSNNKIVPAVGLGFGYTFNLNWAADLSWTKTFSNGSLPKMDFFAVGIAYRFANF